MAAAGHGGQVLVSVSTAALLDADGLRDLGEHRLKDLSAPERIYQLGDEEFPPLRSLHQTNLPIPATPFLGRERELEEVIGLLSQEDVRLLTLTGPGGIGKTRLALQAAGGLSDRYRGGVWWVPLAPLRDPALVLATTAQRLRVRGGLAEHIGDRPMLILLDNFEHVVEAAAEVAGLLASCPNLGVLVTSRQPLQITGEQEYPVPPLAHEEGVNFFLARGRAIRPDFEPDEAVSEICRRLDELPLALELAAARVKILSSHQILERLARSLALLTAGARDLPDRQRTLRATIEWSYELLTPEEQRLFVHLAVFRGGCTLEAAEEVAAADLDGLQSLVDKSLVRHTRNRFWILETIREYAAERLDVSTDADEIRRRHAEHFLALAEEAEPGLRGRTPWQSVDCLASEQDNLRAALEQWHASREADALLRLVGALGRFWSLSAAGPEGRQRLETALAIDEHATPARAKALGEAASLELSGGNAARAKIRAEQALALSRQLGDDWGIARSIGILGWVAVDLERDLPKAQRMLEESVERFREIGDDHRVLVVTGDLAVVHKLRGDREGARVLLEDVLRQARASGDEYMEATALDDLAEYALDEGRIDDGLSLLRESIRMSTRLTRAVRIQENLLRFAYAFAAQKKPEVAASLLSFSTTRIEQTQSVTPYGVAYTAEMKEKTLTLIHGQLEDAALAEAWQQGRTLTEEEALALALNSND